MTDTRTTAELVDVLSDPENYNFSGDGSPLDTFDTDTYQQDFATLTTRIEALERRLRTLASEVAFGVADLNFCSACVRREEHSSCEVSDHRDECIEAVLAWTQATELLDIYVQSTKAME